MENLRPCYRNHKDIFCHDDSNPDPKNAALMKYSVLQVHRSGDWFHQISAAFSSCSIVRRLLYLFGFYGNSAAFSTDSILRGKKAKHEGLPDDIVQDILVKLPVKTLIKFRSVSKLWRSRISHPSFQQDHYSHGLQQSPLLLLARYQVDLTGWRTTYLYLSTHDSCEGTLIDNFSVTLPHRFTDPLVLHACQGLVCISDSFVAQILICNCATKQVFALPLTNCRNDNIGFGYAASTKEFKVVRFYDLNLTGTKYCCEVFTLGTSQWREAKCPPQYQGRFCGGAPFLHGAIHILLPLEKQPNKDACLYAFDIQTEDYTSVPLPASYHSVRSRESYVGTRLKFFGGVLCLNFYFHSVLELWLLKDYTGGKWVKEYTIDFTSLGSNARGEVLTSTGDGSILIMIDGLGYREEPLYFYNPRDKSFTQKSKARYSATLYVESFLSPEVTNDNSA